MADRMRDPLEAAAPARIEDSSLLERYFRLAENQTTVRRELIGGLTTFLTMAYIVIVNPQILSQAGMPAGGVVFATCISAAAATLVMGLYANYPIALAPGMSLNSYFTYSVCLGMHVPWRTALGVIFISGVFFLMLTVTRIREQIVNGIPGCLKHSTAAGIGMFIAFVGLRTEQSWLQRMQGRTAASRPCATFEGRSGSAISARVISTASQAPDSMAAAACSASTRLPLASTGTPPSAERTDRASSSA